MCQPDLPSLLKLRYKKGAHRESSPCQYTYWGWLTTQALSTRLNFRCPSQEESSSSYWWQRGMSTSICHIKKTVITKQVKYYFSSYKREKKYQSETLHLFYESEYAKTPEEYKFIQNTNYGSLLVCNFIHLFLSLSRKLYNSSKLKLMEKIIYLQFQFLITFFPTHYRFKLKKHAPVNHPYLLYY